MATVCPGAIVMNVRTFNPNATRKLQVFRVKSLNSVGKAIVEVVAAPYSAVQAFAVSDLIVKTGDFWTPAVRAPKPDDWVPRPCKRTCLSRSEEA